MELAVLGAGPHGRELADIAARCGYVPVFFDDDPDHGHRPVAEATGPYTIGAAWPEVRHEIHCRCWTGRAPILIDPDASTIGAVSLGPGVVLAAGVRVITGSDIGDHTHVNLNATISRGCQVGEFVTICPGVNISGGVIVENDVFIGAGAVIAHELVIGEGALIGAGAVVVEDVKPFETVMGNPARPR